MSINIKNKEAEQLLDEIKHATGKGTSEIVLGLLRAERAKLDQEKERRIAEALEWTRKWQAEVAAASLPNAPPVGEILDYDENGLPR